MDSCIFSWLLVTIVIILWFQLAESWSSGGQWSSAHATFYGGDDASANMGGACGYDNVYTNGFGATTTAVSSALFQNGAVCGACFQLMCDAEADPKWCLRGKKVRVSVTNFCPPNSALASNNGGWCNSPLRHFDMSLHAFRQIALYKEGIVPILYQRVNCVTRGGVHFTIKGHAFFNLVLLTNVGGSGDVESVWIKGSISPVWRQMQRNWGANWQNNANLNGQGISFRITTGGEYHQTITFTNVVPANWQAGQTFISSHQFL